MDGWKTTSFVLGKVTFSEPNFEMVVSQLGARIFGDNTGDDGYTSLCVSCLKENMFGVVVYPHQNNDPNVEVKHTTNE